MSSYDVAGDIGNGPKEDIASAHPISLRVL